MVNPGPAEPASESAQLPAEQQSDATEAMPGQAIAAGPNKPASASAAAAGDAPPRPEQAGRDGTGEANAAMARASRPDIVLSPVRETEAAAPPRAGRTAPEERRITAAEADALLARGDTFLSAGDLASARLFYEYAAAAGNGAAALRLGGTFDPAFLARARMRWVQGNLPSALYWYRRARELGNGDAEMLLRSIENTAQ
jgi:hypothetical protein